jgi:hypothetical protein
VPQCRQERSSDLCFVPTPSEPNQPVAKLGTELVEIHTRDWLAFTADYFPALGLVLGPHSSNNSPPRDNNRLRHNRTTAIHLDFQVAPSSPPATTTITTNPLAVSPVAAGTVARPNLIDHLASTSSAAASKQPRMKKVHQIDYLCCPGPG